jgi:hypothetical protein
MGRPRSVGVTLVKRPPRYGDRCDNALDMTTREQQRRQRVRELRRTAERLHVIASKGRA